MKHNVSDIVSSQMNKIIKVLVMNRVHIEDFLDKSANNLQGRVMTAVALMVVVIRP